MISTTSKKRLISIPLSEPVISGNEWKYIKECLDTGWVSSVGNYVSKFEETITSYVGVKYAVATVNGTSALHVSLIACGVEPDDEIIVPTLTFVATVNVVKYCRAHPVFMDCRVDTLCIDIQKIIDFIQNECEQLKDGYTYNKKTKRRIKAVIPVHIFGHPVDMHGLMSICNIYNINIIEDATESLGSEYKGEKTGSFGKSGCFSFNGNKIVTTGGGGMVVTNNKSYAEKIRHLTTQARSDSLEYDHDDIGYNYRLCNIQAAMGMAQMEKLEEFVGIKRKNALLYRKYLSDIDRVELLWEMSWAKSNFWFIALRIPKTHKKRMIKYLTSKNIQVRPVWKPIHTLPMYRDCQVYYIDVAIEAYERCINLPCSVNIKENEIKTVVKNIRNYFGKK
jgi:perosamine synthetase